MAHTSRFLSAQSRTNWHAYIHMSCCVGTVGVGWGQLFGGVNISNETVISGNCNYPPGYLPSDPTREKYIILGSPSFWNI